VKIKNKGRKARWGGPSNPALQRTRPPKRREPRALSLAHLEPALKCVKNDKDFRMGCCCRAKAACRSYSKRSDIFDQRHVLKQAAFNVRTASIEPI
jgi:hypothetical protein